VVYEEESMLEPLFVLSFALAFFICLLLLPHYIKRAHEVGMVGLDVHKPNTPKVAESGGVVLMLAYLIGLFVFIPFVGQVLEEEIIGTAATVILSSFIGFVDDVYETSWRTKVLTPLICGVPLAVMRLGRTTMWIPGFREPVDFGIFFYLLILPFIVTACTNATNMFAGLNGLEAGSTAIIALALSVLSLLKGGKQLTGAVILIPFLGAVTAFLLYNRYPSRVFPGDVGTFGMGSVVACSAILAYLERAVFFMFIPHTVNAILFFVGKLKGEAPPKEAPMRPDGTIPAPTVWSFRCLLLRIRPLRERELVYVMWTVVAVFSLAGTLVYGV
jgi:UDP-N-acetylglucosamine--dolichyl-phosphate N-acetylglucosaminephosphotransferase